MARSFRRAMDALFVGATLISGVALVLITAVIPWSVYTRYVLNRAASWPEPMAILLSIVLTFFGAAVCYRLGLHMSVTLLRNAMPQPWRGLTEYLAEGLMGLASAFMVIWGTRLVDTTWHQTIAEFPFLSVGVTYMPIPIGGAILLLFVIERLTIGRPPVIEDAAAAH